MTEYGCLLLPAKLSQPVYRVAQQRHTECEQPSNSKRHSTGDINYFTSIISSCYVLYNLLHTLHRLCTKLVSLRERESKPSWAKEPGKGLAIAAWQATATLQQTGSAVGRCRALIPALGVWHAFASQDLEVLHQSEHNYFHSYQRTLGERSRFVSGEGE